MDISAPTADEFDVKILPNSSLWPADKTLRKQLKPEEWEELRPVIKKLFIDENKTYDKVAAFLRHRNDFHPTYVYFWCRGEIGEANRGLGDTNLRRGRGLGVKEECQVG